jgi:hypothetical protein
LSAESIEIEAMATPARITVCDRAAAVSMAFQARVRPRRGSQNPQQDSRCSGAAELALDLGQLDLERRGSAVGRTDPSGAAAARTSPHDMGEAQTSRHLSRFAVYSLLAAGRRLPIVPV